MANGGYNDIDPLDPISNIGYGAGETPSYALPNETPEHSPQHASFGEQFSQFGEDMKGVGNFALDGLKKAAPYAPAIVNLGRGLFQDTDVNRVRPSLPSSRAEDTIRRMDTDVDTSEQMSQIDRQTRTAMMNPNARVGDKQAAHANAMRQRAQVTERADNRETELENQKLGQLSQAQQQRDQLSSQLRTQANQQYEQQRQQAEAARDRRIDTGLQQFARTYLAQQSERNMSEQQQLTLQALISGNHDEVNQEVVQGLMEDLPEDSEYRPMLEQLTR